MLACACNGSQLTLARLAREFVPSPILRPLALASSSCGLGSAATHGRDSSPSALFLFVSLLDADPRCHAVDVYTSTPYPEK